MLRVGLTGSIAVGKSYVSTVLVELGCHMIDADQVARNVVEPGTAGLRAVVEAFGAEVLNEDGTLDRSRLGAIVFGDAEKRVQLNAILHPLIISSQDEQVRCIEAQDPLGIVVVDAALMIESGSYRRFDKLVVVHCRPDVQLERLVKRDKLSHEEAARRIAAQMPQEEKMRYADYLIDTSDGFEPSRRKAEEVVSELRELAMKPREKSQT